MWPTFKSINCLLQAEFLEVSTLKHHVTCYNDIEMFDVNFPRIAASRNYAIDVSTTYYLVHV